jgi:hypothetical protein
LSAKARASAEKHEKDKPQRHKGTKKDLIFRLTEKTRKGIIRVSLFGIRFGIANNEKRATPLEPASLTGQANHESRFNNNPDTIGN